MPTPEKDSRDHHETLPVKEELHREIRETTEEMERKNDAFWDRICDPTIPVEPRIKHDTSFDEGDRLLKGDSIDWDKVERDQSPLMHMPPMIINGVSEADFVADDEFNESWDRIIPPTIPGTEKDTEPSA